MIRAFSVGLILIAFGACKKSSNEPPTPSASGSGSATGSNTATGSGSADAAATDCAAQAGELRTFLTATFDPAQKVAAPWPTGDAAFDAELPKLREQVRAAAAKTDPAKPAKLLTEGVQPGGLEQELASCPPAGAQLQKVAQATPDQARAEWVGLADAIGACDCKVNIPRVKALLYLSQRGPD